MLTAVCWRWGDLFAPVYVNRLRSMLERHLHIPHELVCVTAQPEGIDPRVRIVAPPAHLAGTPRCRRRMWGYAKERTKEFGTRMLALDLDVVALGDLTPLVDRPEPIVCWKVGYAGVYSGSFVLCNVGELDGAWRAYAKDPNGFPAVTGERNASDQAMLNHFLRGRRVAQWTERDGICTWFGGEYYRKLQHHGAGPDRPIPPAGTRLVVFGSADKAVMDSAAYPWIAANWR